MDAAQALLDLTEISSQVRAVVLVDANGDVEASTFAEVAQAERFADAAKRLLAAADEARSASEPLAQLDVETQDGSVFVVRDGERLIAATTSAQPTVGLVFYDLKSALRAVEEGEAEQPKRASRKRTRKKDEEPEPQTTPEGDAA